MEGDLTIWKRVILITIGVLVAAGILGAVYAWYEASSLNNTETLVTAPATPSQQQQNTIKSLTAPVSAPNNTATTSGASAAPASAGAKAAAYPPAQASKPPPALTAPPPKTSAQQQPDQATINSLTAPSR